MMSDAALSDSGADFTQRLDFNSILHLFDLKDAYKRSRDPEEN